MKRVAVLGMPNTGKSTFFNRLTGAMAHVGNWPGITVDLMMATLEIGDMKTEVIDLPGIYDLRGFSEDEAVVQRFLESTPVHLIVIVLNKAQLDRQLSLALQIKHLHLPAVVLLNMADEAPKFGVSVDIEVLAQRLGMPVIPISAKYGKGFDQVLETIAHQLKDQPSPVTASDFSERLIANEQLAEELEEVLRDAVKMSAQPPKTLTTRLDRILLHPVFGLPLFFGAMYLLFQTVYSLSQPLQDGLTAGLDWFKTVGLEPLLAQAPPLLQGFLIDGLYEGIGTVTAFLPVIFLFFLCMAVVEDSGYLARSAFLMDAFMERLGLDGRSFVMALMGFGCNVPAIMGLRVMRSPGLRMLSMLIIPFSLCSARLNVFLFITTALFTAQQAPLVLFSLYLLSFGAAVLTAALFKGRFPSQEPMVLELPPYRFPTLKQMLLRAWHEVKHFVFWTRKFIIFGVIIIWFCTHFPTDVPAASDKTIAGMIGQGLSPLLNPLGISPKLAVALLFGFIAKEIVLGGLAVIYSTQEDAGLSQVLASQIDWVQGYSFMLFTLLYTPCLSTIAVIKAESKSLKFAWLSVLWSLGLACLASLTFYQGVRLLSHL